MRGEYCWQPSRKCRSSGSSPHAWGILTPKRSTAGPSRFIPTCVGNTHRASAGGAHRPVHPHMRGEYSEYALSKMGLLGSSPHAWGIREGEARQCGQPRFIPTCVGNTSCPFTESLIETVHPHMRGEYAAAQFGQQQARGSSPHAWGIRVSSSFNYAPNRFIPTCVGNTRRRSSASSRRAVHPHMRGEYV